MTPIILFDLPPRNLDVLNGDVHVFCATLDAAPPRLEQLAGTLSADERDRVSRFVFERDRTRFVVGRGILREILGWLLHVEPAQLAFAYGSYGKPRLAAPLNDRILHFNLAHSDGLVVYAISAHHEVGIDVERIRPVRGAEEIAARFFSTSENTELYSVPEKQRTGAFLNCWTRKEARLKAIGIGISELSNQSEALPLSSQSRSALLPGIDPPVLSRLCSFSLKPARHYTGAVSAECGRCPRCWKWMRL